MSRGRDLCGRIADRRRVANWLRAGIIRFASFIASPSPDLRGSKTNSANGKYKVIRQGRRGAKLHQKWTQEYQIGGKIPRERPPQPVANSEANLKSVCMGVSMCLISQNFATNLDLANLAFLRPISMHFIARFCLASRQSGLIGMARGEHGGTLKSKVTK